MSSGLALCIGLMLGALMTHIAYFLTRVASQRRRRAKASWSILREAPDRSEWDRW